MKDLKGVEKYSEEYDLIMDLEMQVVANAYDTEGYSIKLPNDITGMSIKRSLTVTALCIQIKLGR